MKKAIIIILSILCIVIIPIISYMIMDHKMNNTTPNPTNAKKTYQEQVKENTKTIEGISYKITLTDQSSVDAVIATMHKMTHQKVLADEKWGAIPMTDDTIKQVENIVVNSNFEIKENLLHILEKWKTGDFSTIDEDHNYFWKYAGGTIGEAYGILSPEEEATFIENNFKK